MQAEERATGSIELRLYWQYLAAWSPWFAIPAATAAFAIGERVFTVSGSHGMSIGMLRCCRRLSLHYAARLMRPGYSMHSRHATSASGCPAGSASAKV